MLLQNQPLLGERRPALGVPRKHLARLAKDPRIGNRAASHRDRLHATKVDHREDIFGCLHIPRAEYQAIGIATDERGQGRPTATTNVTLFDRTRMDRRPGKPALIGSIKDTLESQSHRRRLIPSPT